MSQEQQQQMMNDTLFTLNAMRQQETDGYKTVDYMHQSQPASSTIASRGPLHATASISAPLVLDIDIDCRTKMAAWCYQVVDFCKFNRETVSIAMNILDRFMMTDASVHAKSDRKTYQLAAMTALYTAVKIHEPEAMDPKLISNLSRGTYTSQEVEAMEMQLLTALTWRVNPPTSMAFVRQYIELVGLEKEDVNTKDTIYDLAKFQTELAVSEYDFLSVKPSTVAYCSLMNALESVGMDDFTLSQISKTIGEAIQVTPSDNVSQIQTWLYQAIVQEPSARAAVVRSEARNISSNNNTAKKAHLERQSSHEVSPRSVSM